MMNKFYIYRHVRLDTNKVFYIGKGRVREDRTSFKSSHYRAFSTQGRSIWWKRITDKTPYEVEIIFSSDDESIIFEKEKEFIELYGRKDLGTGTLVNLTEGGEGDCGRVVSEETKLMLSLQRKGKPVHTEESKKLLSIANSGKNNPMYGTTQCRKKVRLNQIEQSTPVEVTDKDGNITVYKCTRDVADAFNVHISTVKDRIISDTKGKYSIRGIFKGYKLKRLYNE